MDGQTAVTAASLVSNVTSMANDTIHATAVKTDGALERDFEMLFNFITLF